MNNPKFVCSRKETAFFMKTFHMLVNNLAMMNLAPTGFSFILGIQYIDGSCSDSSSILMSNKLLNLIASSFISIRVRKDLE